MCPISLPFGQCHSVSSIRLSDWTLATSTSAAGRQAPPLSSGSQMASSTSPISSSPTVPVSNELSALQVLGLRRAAAWKFRGLVRHLIPWHQVPMLEGMDIVLLWECCHASFAASLPDFQYFERRSSYKLPEQRLSTPELTACTSLLIRSQEAHLM